GPLRLGRRRRCLPRARPPLGRSRTGERDPSCPEFSSNETGAAMKLTRRSCTLLGALGALVVLVASLLPASAQQAAPEPGKHPATAGALPTPQTDGIVFSIEIVGNTAYV